MASIETPPQVEDQSGKVTVVPGGGRVRAANRAADGEFHLLISELQDENSRSRMREAVWISIILHMLVLFTINSAPSLFFMKPVRTLTPAEMLQQREKELTYLDLPPDIQKAIKPKSSIISDKDRTASARNPQLTKDVLKQLRDNRRSGPPMQQAAPQQQAQQPQMAQQAAPEQQQAQQNPPQPQISKMTPPQEAKKIPEGTFKVGASAGEVVQQAARASAGAQGGNIGGDYGSGPAAPNTDVKSDLDIMSDTMGVDFSPYLQRVLHSVRQNWYNLIPEAARSPLLEKGKVTIEFVIGKNGTVDGMRLSGPSGDVALDRAAWGGITASNPFPPLPGEFRGDHLALRFHFYYNPDRNEMR